MMSVPCIETPFAMCACIKLHVTHCRYPCTPGASLPGAPYHVDIAPSNGSVTVTWEPPEKDTGAPVQLYFVNVSQVESSATRTLFCRAELVACLPQHCVAGTFIPYA